MKEYLKKPDPWIHLHGIWSILGMILFIPLYEAAMILMTVGSSSYYIALGCLWGDPPILLVLFFVIWAPVFPLMNLVFYILFLWKKYKTPYLVLTAADTLILTIWFVHALCSGNTYGARGMIVDVIISIGMTVAMFLAFFRKLPSEEANISTLET